MIYANCAKRSRIKWKTKKVFLKFDFSHLRNSWNSNLECVLPWLESTFIVNLIPFWLDITELRMREITTLLFLSIYSLCFGAPLFLEPHNTLPCVLLYRAPLEYLNRTYTCSWNALMEQSFLILNKQKYILT